MNVAPQFRISRSLLGSLGLAAALLSAPGGFAQEKSPTQASPGKIGLKIVSPVMIGGSDDASEKFQEDVLPKITDLLGETLGERKQVDDGAMALDASKLKLQTDSDVRVYFIGEGAGYENSLGFNTSGTGIKEGDPLLIFPNASTALDGLGSEGDLSEYSEKELKKMRKTSTPLLAGDFVDLGRFSGGTQLDFFLIANGYKGGTDVFTADGSSNPDGINHVVAFAYAMEDSPYLIVGFEDLYGGGDRDFNDLLFAVDIGAANVAALTATPEPATYLTLGACLTCGLAWKRRQDRANGTTPARA